MTSPTHVLTIHLLHLLQHHNKVQLIPEADSCFDYIHCYGFFYICCNTITKYSSSRKHSCFDYIHCQGFFYICCNTITKYSSSRKQPRSWDLERKRTGQWDQYKGQLNYNWIALKQQHSSTVLHYDCVFKLIAFGLYSSHNKLFFNRRQLMVSASVQ